MIHLTNLSYVRLGTRDLELAGKFIRRIVGLEEVRREGASIYFRGDDRDHTLVYFDGDPADHTTGWEVADAAALHAAASELEVRRITVRRGTTDECGQRRVREFINFRDPSGNSMDIVVGPQHCGRRFFPLRDNGVYSFSHIGLRTTDARRDETFWTTVLNARVSDWIGPAPLMRIDEVHHKIAMFPSTFPGVQHINHQVRSIDDVMRSYYFLREQGVKIVFGPGRHPTSTAIFLYFEGPDGMVYEYSTGVRMIQPEEEATYRPRQFPFDAGSFCMWGSKPDIPEFKS